MGSTRRMPTGVRMWSGAAVAAAAAAAGLLVLAGLLMVAGCTLDKVESRPQGIFNRIGGHGPGQVIEPKRCLVRVAILNRPYRDPAINEIAWRAADEQAISPAERRALEANGLRVGRIIGTLPKELESILNEGGPQNPKVVPINLLVESGESSLISINQAVAQVSLLLNRDNRVSGRDYQAASGFYRLTAKHDGAHGVSLRLIPEIHHGPLQRTFPALPNAAGFAPQELSIRDGQQEEILGELAVALALEPEQVAVIGCRPEYQRSLGSFLFSEAASDSGPQHQRLILVWASRNLAGVTDEKSKTSDRPKLFQRRAAPPPPPAPSPPTPNPTLPPP